jgi:hypothetical protein
MSDVLLAGLHSIERLLHKQLEAEGLHNPSLCGVQSAYNVVYCTKTTVIAGITSTTHFI